MKKFETVNMTLCALFAALSAALSQVAVPVGPVPITLTFISIFMAAGLLGMKYGVVSQLVFVALGAVGLPVFSGFSGGIGVIAGPRGGFIMGYIVCAFVIGLAADRLGRRVAVMATAMVIGTIAVYAMGTLWYMVTTGTAFAAALAVCVVPFLPGDAAKIILSAALVNRLAPVLDKIRRNKTANG